MAATVSYKGSTIATISNQTKTLTTSGKYMEADVVITDSSGGDSKENEIITRTISGTYENNEVTSIGYYAFAFCSKLTSVNFPNVTVIESSAFTYCSSLSSMSFPNVTSVKGYAFAYCSNLTSVNFPKLTNTESGIFLSCRNLTTAIFSKMDMLGINMFGSCYNLTTISFPSARTIGTSTFAFCSKLSLISFPNVSSIDDRAFYSCLGLTFVSFPNVRSIGSSAFYNCTSLSTIILNHSSTLAGAFSSYAFAKCFNLLSLYLLASKIYYLNNSVYTFSSTPISNYTKSTGGVHGSIFVPSSLYNSYITSAYWSYYSSRFVSLTDAQISKVLASGTHL